MDVENKINLENDAFSKISFRKKKVVDRGKEHQTDDRAPINIHVGQSRFNIDPELMEADPDHVYAYIAYMDGSEPRQDYIDDATERDWWPVKRSEHPMLQQKYCNDVFRAKDESGDDYIKRGGQLLMKRPRDYHEAENAAFANLNKKHEEFSKSMKLFEHSYRGPIRPGF